MAIQLALELLVRLRNQDREPVDLRQSDVEEWISRPRIRCHLRLCWAGAIIGA